MRKSNNNQITKNDRAHIGLIRDAIIGASFHMPDPEVFIYVFTDYLCLLFQRPLVFSYWKDDVCIFSSFADPYYSPFFEDYLSVKPTAQSVFISQDYSLTVRSLDYKGQALSFDIDEKATNMVSMLLKSDSTFMDAVIELIKKSLEIKASKGTFYKKERYELPQNTLEIDNKELSKLLQPLRPVIDEAFSEAAKSSHLIINEEGKREFNIPKIFTVARTINHAQKRYSETFAYTAGLILSLKQRDALKRWCNAGCKSAIKSKKIHCQLNYNFSEDCLNVLEYPLGLNSRSIADSVFSSGIVDFGRKAGDKMWDIVGDGDDKSRQKAERCVYPEVEKLFYTPIHVGGTPWLAIFTFTTSPVTRQENWLYNYSFYRDILQKAAALIRKKTQDVYIELLTKKLVECIKSWRTKDANAIAKEVNKEWQKLAQVYPYDIVTLHVDSHKEDSIYVAGRGRFGLTIKNNPFFPTQVEWEKCEKAVIVNECKREVQRFTDNESYFESSAIAYSSHLLKVPLRVLKSITTISDESDRIKVMDFQVNKILDLHKFASYVISKKMPYSQESSFSKFISLIRKYCEETIVYLGHPEVVGNRADTLKKMAKEGALDVKLSVPRDYSNNTIKYFKNLIIAILDGILTNALDNIDEDKPMISLCISQSDYQNDKMIYLEIDNSTFLEEDDIKKTVDDLNSGRSDMVGITSIYWACEACWGSNMRPRWHGSNKTITVKVPIGEMKE